MVSIEGIKSLIILTLSGILINSSYAQVNTIKIGMVGNSITLGIGSTDGLGFRKSLFDKLTNDGVNFDFVGSRGIAPYEGHFESGARIEEFYTGGFGTGENDIAAHMNTYKPEMLLIHLGTNNVKNVLNDVVPYSNDNGISFLNTASGQLAELIQYAMGWKNGTNGSFLKRILVCKIIPKTISTTEDDFNNELQNFVNDINNGNVPSIPPGNVILVDQYSSFDIATMLDPDGIHPNDSGYLNMAEVYKNAVINAINSVDDFNRSNLGSKWTVGSEFTISNGELSNTSTDESWGHLAVYNDLTDPSEVSIKWGQNANAAGILEGGLALLLNSPSTSADGYMIWHNGSSLTLWTIVNGAPGSGVDNTSALRPPPQAGDVFKVVISENGNDVDFKAYVNGLLDGTVTASNVNTSLSKVTNVNGYFAGVIPHGNRQNNYDDFTLKNATSPPAGDGTPPDDITDLTINSSTTTSIELMWTTPGDDGNVGTANSYDIRYSTSPIDAANFTSAVAVSNPPDPLPPGNAQKYSVTNLSTNTLYYFAIKTLDEVLNISAISNVVSSTTQEGSITVDNFDRAQIGIDWAFSSDYSIENEELACSATSWGSMAVYKRRRNPVDVSIKFGVNATQNGISRTAITLLLDSASEFASGYMVWRNGSKLDIWSVANGAPLAGISNVDGLLPAPVAGDVFRVVLSEDEVSYRFTCYINGVLDGTITATKNSQSFAKISIAESYAGVKLSGGSGASNIDDFTMVVPTGTPSFIEYISGDAQADTIGKKLTDPLVARVIDENGNPISNAQVNFQVISGDGSLEQPPAPDDHIRIEAESGTLVFPMQEFSDGLASGGKYIEVPADLSNGTATYEFTVPAAGTYVIWGRVIAASGSEDSFRISVDGSPAFIWDTFQGNHKSSWTWDQVSDRGSGNVSSPQFNPVFFDLSSGNHTLLVKKRDELTKLDKILITKDLNYTPSGTENLSGWVTDSNGEVETNYTLGTVAGINTIHATSTGLGGSPVIFNVTALADVAKTLLIVSGNNQSGDAGNPLAEPFKVQFLDQFNNPVAGKSVTFEVFEGGGTLVEAQPVLTDGDGIAAATLNLGTVIANNRVRVADPTTTPSEVIFTATGVGGVATDLNIVSGNNQQSAAGAVLAAPFVIQILDGNGDGVPDFPIEWKVVQGNGVLQQPTSTQTDANGLSQNTLQLATDTDANLVRAVATGFDSVLFTAIASSGIAKSIVLVSGNGQEGVVGKQLQEPIKVKVVDAQSTGMSNYDVLFVIIEGNGTIVESQPIQTDPDGIAQANWKLGNIAGLNRIEARALALQGSPINFVATGIPDIPVGMVKVSGDSASGSISQQLLAPFVTEVSDQYGNKVSDVSIEFTVLEGGGQFSNGEQVISVNTDSIGNASVLLTLGPIAGEHNNKVQAKKVGLTGSPQEFVASANPGDPVRIVQISGDGQTDFINQPLLEDFVVKVMDANNNVIANHRIDFTIQGGGGKLNGSSDSVSVFTDGNGLASVKLTLGSVGGNLNNVVQAVANFDDNPLQNSPFNFEASALYTGTKIQMVSGNGQSAVVTSVLQSPLVIQIFNVIDEPVVNMPVEFEIISGGGSLDNLDTTNVIKQTDNEGKASVLLQIGQTIGENINVVHVKADNGLIALDGSPIVFSATGVASNATQVQISEGNNQTGIAGEKLTNNIKVVVMDSLDNPIVGHPVTFTVAKGEGFFEIQNSTIQDNDNITIQSVNTDANGIAKVNWVVGTEAGENNNEVEAATTDGINPLDNSPITFIASVNPAITDPDTSNIIATDSIVANGNAVSNVTVTLLDRFGNPIPGKFVQISSTGTQNFIGQPQSQTDANGQTTATLASITAEIKTITAVNTSDNIALNSSTQAKFVSDVADRISRTRGHDQTRNIGTFLKNPLVVTVSDRFGNPVAGIPVFFEVISGGGSILENQPVLTDENGEAGASVSLGGTPGSNFIEARSGSLIGNPIVFSATGANNPAQMLVKISGDDQVGKAGGPLSELLVVQTLDAENNPVKNVPITFSVIFGGGNVTPPQPVLTDANGFASTVYTLGPNIGQNVAKAENTGLQNSPVSFIANATPSDAAEILLVAGHPQVGQVESSGSALVVKVVDPFNNPVAGTAVTFELISGGITLTTTQPVITNNSGLAQASFIHGTIHGNSTVHASSSSLSGSPVVFEVTTTGGAAASMALDRGNNQIGTVDQFLLEPLAVKVVDKFNNPVTGHEITFVLTGGDASIDGGTSKIVGSNSEGIASVSLKLGSTPGNIVVLAIASTLPGSPVTFNVESVQNNLPSISIGFQSVTIQENISLSFNVTGSDPDNDPLEFKIYDQPAGSEFEESSSNVFSFKWKPSFDQEGSYLVKFAVFDDKGGSSKDTVEISVANVNRKPVITNFSPTEANPVVGVGQNQIFSVTAIDPDGQDLVYFWTKNGENAAAGNQYNYFAPPIVTSERIEAFVTDGEDTASVKWVVDVITSVQLEFFTATVVQSGLGVELAWRTASEEDNLGFNLYRSTQRNDDYKQINEVMIPSNPSGEYSYKDENILSGTRYYYKLEDINISGDNGVYGPILAELTLPVDFALSQNYPNPFNPETTINYQLPNNSQVYLSIYNVIGQEVRVLINQELSAGYHSVVWDGRDNHGNLVTSGVYYFRIKADLYTDLKKMIFMK